MLFVKYLYNVFSPQVCFVMNKDRREKSREKQKKEKQFKTEDTADYCRSN